MDSGASQATQSMVSARAGRDCATNTSLRLELTNWLKESTRNGEDCGSCMTVWGRRARGLKFFTGKFFTGKAVLS